MRSLPYVSILVFGTLFGCTNEGIESNVSNTTGEEVEVDSRTNPSDVFIDFTLEIEAQNWVSDTARINKIGLYLLEGVKVKSFENRLFYDLKYDQTEVATALRNSPSEDEWKANHAFSKVDQIWGYFYRDKDGKGMISDGVIEQWIYPNEAKAKTAFDYFEKYGNNIFFNTMPFFHREGESIYIFHTRAMAFSYDQKPLFESFLAKFPSTETNVKK